MPRFAETCGFNQAGPTCFGASSDVQLWVELSTLRSSRAGSQGSALVFAWCRTRVSRASTASSAGRCLDEWLPPIVVVA